MSFTRRPGSGCPQQTSCREDRHIAKHVRAKPIASSAIIQAQGPRRSLRVLPLTPIHQPLRLEWCRARRNWTAAEWNQVVLSDESIFNLSNDGNRVDVWRSRGEHLNPAFLLRRHTTPTAGKDGLYLARVLSSFNPASDISFFPQYGDELFPNPPFEDIKNGRFHKIPLLIGHNSNEGVTEVTSFPELFGFFGDSTPMINKTSAKFLLQNVFLGRSCTIDSVGSYYFNSIGDNDFFNIRQKLYVAYGDIVFACPTTFFAERYSQRNNTVYFYLFTHRPSISPWAPWIGVTHYDEIQFIFGQPIRDRARYTVHEFDLSMKLVKFWTNFAKFG
ncbi:acetylcholinesterase-1 [Trichonephila clavipes]|nr:acetylcholinesterase-1 [Trichonephila clavipes]